MVGVGDFCAFDAENYSFAFLFDASGVEVVPDAGFAGFGFGFDEYFFVVTVEGTFETGHWAGFYYVGGH